MEIINFIMLVLFFTAGTVGHAKYILVIILKILNCNVSANMADLCD